MRRRTPIALVALALAALNGCAATTPEDIERRDAAAARVLTAKEQLDDAREIYNQSPSEQAFAAVLAARDEYVAALERQVEVEAEIIAGRTERTGMNLAQVIAAAGGALGTLFGLGGAARKGVLL